MKAPTDPPYKVTGKIPQAPKAHLKRDYVYGVRCKDMRNNVKYLGTNKIVYNAAALGIVLDQENNT
jgi:hypothetical protein